MNRYLSSHIVMVIAALAEACGGDDPGTMASAAASPAPNATATGAAGTASTTDSSASNAIAGRAATATAPAAGSSTASSATLPTGMANAAGTGATAPQPGSASVMGEAGTGAAGANVAAAGSDSQPATAAMGDGSCCADGNCLCREEPPSALTDEDGPYEVDSYAHSAGCIYYPTDAEPPFAAVAISDGFGGSGGCGRTQTDGWGPLYASHGIVAMIINTGSGDQPNVRGQKLGAGIDAFKEENEDSASPLHGKLAGRYGTSGFSMGGGGTSYASRDDSSLLSSVAIMPWGPVNSGVEVPTLVICGSSDTIASCSSHGNSLYNGIDDSVSKMRVVVQSGHAGQPTAGGGNSGKYGLAFQKLFLEGDERWRPLLASAESEESNIE